MVDSEFIESVLKIFATRAAAELERMRAEEALRVSESITRDLRSERGRDLHPRLDTAPSWM